MPCTAPREGTANQKKYQKHGAADLISLQCHIHLVYFSDPSPSLSLPSAFHSHLSLHGFTQELCALLECMQTKLFLFLLSFCVHLSQLMPKVFWTLSDLTHSRWNTDLLSLASLSLSSVSVWLVHSRVHSVGCYPVRKFVRPSEGPISTFCPSFLRFPATTFQFPLHC